MIFAKKNLGQHFLINPGIIERISAEVRSLTQEGLYPVCEIGPGMGALTASLLQKNLKVLAIEIDPRMVEHLQSHFKEEISKKQLQVIQKDVLSWSPEEFSQKIETKEPVVFCGNLPYNIGSEIIFHLLENFSQAERFCFMLQKEVVKRFIATQGSGKDYGALSIKMAWLCHIKSFFWVRPGSFKPAPKVESGVFSFERKKVASELDPLLRGRKYDQFNKFISRIFQKRRKMLRTQLPQLQHSPLGTRRPEELSPEEWLILAAENVWE